MSELPLWDEADALKRVMGKDAILKVMVMSFLSDMPNYAETLDRELSQDDIENATKTAHAIKGVAGNLSTLALAEVAKKIELGCRTAEPLSQIKHYHDEFKVLFPKTLEILSAWFASK